MDSAVLTSWDTHRNRECMNMGDVYNNNKYMHDDCMCMCTCMYVYTDMYVMEIRYEQCVTCMYMYMYMSVYVCTQVEGETNERIV